MTLASFSGKGLQIRILENIFDLLLLKYGGNYLPLPSLDSVDEEHQEIVEQVIKGNWERARDIMKKHIKNVEKQVIKSLKQMLMEMEDFKSEAI
jgi:DNA-binding GntR family transcriptional regulator